VLGRLVLDSVLPINEVTELSDLADRRTDAVLCPEDFPLDGPGIVDCQLDSLTLHRLRGLHVAGRSSLTSQR
jgi:hypothetical protein